MSAPPIHRRDLHFQTLDQITADACQLAKSEKLGKLHQSGNWTLGQTCNHLATWIDYSYDGIPLKIPWFLRLILRPMKNRMLNKPMRSGGKIPGVPNGTLATDSLSTDEGLAKLTQSCQRLTNNCPLDPHPIFGSMSHDQWKKITLRHAELHLSFLRAD
jgi:Protein of unknown function (DUF1569)